MTLADRGSGSNTDDDVREVLTSCPSQTKPPELDRRVERRERAPRDPGVVLGRPVHEHVHVSAREPDGGGDDESGDEERRDRVACLEAGRHGDQAGENGEGAGEVVPK